MITGRREEVIDRDVEESLDLAGVQVQRHDPVGARAFEQAGDQLGGDRHAAFHLPVLAPVAVIGQDRGDAFRGRRASTRR